MYKGVVDVAERFAEVINAELKGLVAAGADFIQIDEPARGNVTGEEMARLFNLATEGVKAKLAFHICFGNRFGRSPLRPRPTGRTSPALWRRGPTSSCWSSPAASCPRWSSGRSTGRGPRAGRRRRRRQGLLHRDARRTWPSGSAGCSRSCRPRSSDVNPDCGFGWSPRYMCNQKIRALAAGARLVRKELGAG